MPQPRVRHNSIVHAATRRPLWVIPGSREANTKRYRQSDVLVPAPPLARPSTWDDDPVEQHQIHHHPITTPRNIELG